MSTWTREELLAAAATLRANLKLAAIAANVGIAATTLVVYCERAKDVPRVPSEWSGVRVHAKHAGRLRPIHP